MSVNVENSNYKDLKSICRTCMLTCDLKFTQDKVISNIFYKLTDIHFETSDELPQQICRNCFEKILEIHAFSLQCKRTHSRLTKYLTNRKTVELNREQDANNGKTDVENVLVEEHKIEFIEVDETNPPEVEIKEEIKEETTNEVLLPETHFIDVHNFDLSKPNTSDDIKVEMNDDEKSDFNEDTNSSYFSDNSNADSADFSHKNKEKKYECNVCNKTFSYLRSFKKHRSLHGGGRPHKCKYCSKTFSESSNLTNHMRTHGAERPYLCPYCDWDFADLDELTNHKRAHTGKRPYQCSLCNSCFARKENLTNHLLVHSDEIPCECPICGKKFKDANHMMQHRRTHTKDKPFKCDECDLLFQNLYNLQKHERAYHKDVQFQYDVS